MVFFITSMEASFKKWFARKFSCIKWLDRVISGCPTLCINWTGSCPSFIKWLARKFSCIKRIDHVISGGPTLCIKWTGSCPSFLKWFARKFSSIKWLGWCISWLYKMLCSNFLSIKCPGCSKNSLLKGQVSLYKKPQRKNIGSTSLGRHVSLKWMVWHVMAIPWSAAYTESFPCGKPAGYKLESQRCIKSSSRSKGMLLRKTRLFQAFSPISPMVGV